MDRFILCPLREGYSFTAGNNLREQETEGGMPRQVPFFIGAVHRVKVTVLLKTKGARQYFWAFWRLKQRKPENWLWKLSLDNGISEECECRFISSSLPSESYRNKTVLKVTFEVLVKPIYRSEIDDRNIVNYHQGGLSPEIEKVPNEWFPAATGVNNG